MIKLLRNRENLALLCFLGICSGVGTAACFFTGGLLPGMIAAVMCAFMLAAQMVYTRARYREIARLSGQLYRIASGDYKVDLTRYGEGELSILYDELHKVTRTLRHQALALEKDKAWLADTMADISHQLKTPLTSISMLAELLENPQLPPEKKAEFLSGIQSGAERIRWLVLSLLKLSRLDANAVVLRKEPVCVEELVKHACKPLQIPMELRGQTLRLELCGAVVPGDFEWLVEAVSNLLKNCVEYAGAGREVHVRCEDNPLYILLEVGDNGPGIPKEELPFIFNRFYRGKNAAPDSIGIGLALSKSIIMRHGGTLEAQSGFGQGARFLIKFYKNAV